MGALSQIRLSSMLVALALLALVLAACAPDPTAQLISPNMVVETEEEEIVVATPTPLPSIEDLTEDEIYAGLPEKVHAAALEADPAEGKKIAELQGCLGCHGTAEGEVKVGPSWYNLANRAVTRVPGESPALYIYKSIVDPSAYVVEGFPDGVMPKDYGAKLSERELGALVAYLLTFRGE